MTNVIECRDRDSWLRERGKLITASDAAAALGLNPFKSPLHLYTEKLGLVEDPGESESCKWGRFLQDGIGARFAEVTGRTVTSAPPFTIWLHPQAPFLGATLDFFESDKAKGDGVLEAKATSYEWKDEPPVYYQVQNQLQVAIVGRAYGTVAAFQGLRKPPAWADIEPNETFLKRAISKLEEFQWRVQNRKPPEVLDGSDSTAEALKLLYPWEQVPTIALPPEALEWTTELAKLKASRRAVDEAIAERENRLKAQIGDAELGLLVDGSCWQWRVEPRSGYEVRPSEPRVLRLKKGGR
jgi:putative phage-type endonuclease